VAVEYVEVARNVSEHGELVLRRHRDPDGGPAVLELRANGLFVMDSAEHASERALAEAALALVDRPTRVVVAGLGLGFTLDRVLADRRVAECVVVEIASALVDWMRDGTIPHGPQLLADRRARVVVADIAQAVAEAEHASYDVVLLDVDNGPDNLVHQSNAALYGVAFLSDVRRVLTSGGVVAVWSAAPAPELLERLRTVFGTVEEVAQHVRLQQRDEHYWLYVGRATGSELAANEEQSARE
jgi:spermidine synthase